MLPTSSMTRVELLKIVVGQARVNGFEFRHWYTKALGVPWTNAGDAFALLETQRRYYGLLFSHEFASSFWKAGSEITFQVERHTFERSLPNGKVATVTRKAFTRRSARKDVWRYHLREMALADDPLRYVRKYLRVEEDLDERPASGAAASKDNKGSAGGKKPAFGTKSAKRAPRPLPTELPAFLRRPYP